MLAFVLLLALLGLVFGVAWRRTNSALAAAPVTTDTPAPREIPPNLSFDEYVAGGLRDIQITLVQAARRLRD
ncbi:MAG TPA: hypothetical protein VFK41_13235 [Nocardioidaceae bacterium]|nr:hypothetical protein [Nocardioidaceae bacterium]